MKQTLIIFFLAISTLSYSQSTTTTNFKKLEWLIGTWSRTNMTKPGRTAFEVWEQKSPNQLGGYSIVMQGRDTIFKEKFELIIRDDSMYYVADVPENKEPVYFKITAISENGFVCENPQHDFPKKISYQLVGTTLKAQISGDGNSSDFIFKRK